MQNTIYINGTPCTVERPHMPWFLYCDRVHRVIVVKFNIKKKRRYLTHTYISNTMDMLKWFHSSNHSFIKYFILYISNYRFGQTKSVKIIKMSINDYLRFYVPLKNISHDNYLFRVDDNYLFRANDSYLFRAEDNYLFRAHDNYLFRANDSYLFRAKDNYLFRSDDKYLFRSDNNYIFRADDNYLFRADENWVHGFTAFLGTTRLDLCRIVDIWRPWCCRNWVLPPTKVPSLWFNYS
jgi:hypothetical protein